MPIKDLFTRDSAPRLQSNLGAFTRAAWSTLHPNSKLSWGWSNDLLAEHLTRVRDGKERRLILNQPPRTGKSSLASICFPTWCWLTRPSLSFLCISSDMDLSVAFNAERKRLIESDWFQTLFADRFELSGERGDDAFSNTHGGRMQAASIASRSLGRGGDVLICDDINAADSIHSAASRKATADFIDGTLMQRLNDPAESAIVVVAQRLHEADATGHLLTSQPEQWKHISLSLMADADEVWNFPSGRVIRRLTNESLDPKRFPPRVIEQRRKNRMTWASQDQQKPINAVGNLIRRSDLRYFGGVDPATRSPDPALPAEFDLKIISVDCSFTDAAAADFVSIITIGVKGGKRFVLDVFNDRVGAVATEMQILKRRELFGPVAAVLIEKKGNGPSVVERLKMTVPGVVPCEPLGSKVSRMFVLSAEMQGHDWFIDRRAPWAEAFVEQLTEFPASKFDDMADATSQACCWLQTNFYSGDTSAVQNYFAGVESGVFPFKSTTPPPTHAKLFQFEMKVRGLKPVDSETFKINVPPCPDCRLACVTALNAGFRCSQCGIAFQFDGREYLVTFRPPPVSAATGCPRCSSSLWRELGGAGSHCNQCGYNSGQPLLPKNGVTRGGIETFAGGKATISTGAFRNALRRLVPGWK
jgi:predicted phage terminase large subunit-like protein